MEISKGVELISNTRDQQLNELGYTIEKDAQNYPDGQLIMAAIALITEGESLMHSRLTNTDLLNELKKPRSYKRRLEIAGAWIAAEIDIIEYQK